MQVREPQLCFVGSVCSGRARERDNHLEVELRRTVEGALKRWEGALWRHFAGAADWDV